MNRDSLRRAVSKIWQIVQKDKALTISALKKRCHSLSQEEFFAGIGWLLKEDTVALEKGKLVCNIPQYSNYWRD